MRVRVLVAATIAGLTGAFCWLLLTHFHQGAADFSWAIRAARYMLARRNPYDTPLQQYPLTAAVFGLPFLHFPAEIAAALFFGISSGLLAFGLTRHGNYHRLLVLLAYPYWAALLTAQWSPLIAASAFFPLLLPVTMAKPQVGLPVFFTYVGRRGALACLGVGALTLIFVPKWPLLWIQQFGYYEHFFPLLVLPGFLLVFALARYRDRDAVFLLLSALVPQRWFFDAFVLWLIPKSRREILATVVASWGVGIWRWYHMPHSMNEVGLWSVLGFYLPMLLIILLRSGDHQTDASATSA